MTLEWRLGDAAPNCYIFFMLLRMSRKVVETLEFRGVLIVLALAGALILYFSAYHGFRKPPDDLKPSPTVPKGEQAPIDRF